MASTMFSDPDDEFQDIVYNDPILRKVDADERRVDMTDEDHLVVYDAELDLPEDDTPGFWRDQ